MIQKPEISVIIPFFNAKETLDRAIRSISNQCFSNFECILIDNNSTDNSIGIANSVCNIDKRFKLITETKQGVMFANNTGCSIANGKYIARMDADDEALPNRLKMQFQFLEKNKNFDVVTGLVNYMPHKTNTEGFARYVDWVNSLPNYEAIFNQRFIDAPVINPSTMWRKTVGDKYGLYQSGDFPEDYEMWLRWMSNGIKIGKVNEKILNWYDSDIRLTRTHKIYRDEAFYTIKAKYLTAYLKKVNPHYPKVAIWGASRISRKWINLLEQNNIEISFYIDTKKERQLDKPVIYYKDIPGSDDCFILILMKHQILRKQIHNFLIAKDYSEGKNFLHLS